MNDPVVRTDFVGIHTDGVRRKIIVEIGKPYLCGHEEWACSVALEGLYANLPDIHAGDALQALCLATRLALQLLAGFQEDGGKLEFSEDGEEVSLDAYFFKPLPKRDA